MSSIKLESNASGTGIFTIASPNSNTNRTLTLPDATGTIITTAGGAAISGTTGAFTTTVGVGGATPAASGAGITFPATASASSDANTLDDYEEGTWTPSLGGNTTYSVQSGNYVKIGKVVTINFSITVTSIGTGSVNTISGLPFSSATQGTGLVGYFGNLAAGWGSLGFFSDGTTLRNISITTGSTTQSVDRGIFGNSTRIDGCSITYQI